MLFLDDASDIKRQFWWDSLPSFPARVVLSVCLLLMMYDSPRYRHFEEIY